MKAIIRTAALSLALLLSACTPTIPKTIPYLDNTASAWQLDLFGPRPLSSDEIESGYELGYTIGRVEPEELSDEVLACKAEILEAIAAYEPHMSHIPNLRYRRYSSAEEALAFIGYAPLRVPDIGIPLNHREDMPDFRPVTVTVRGNMEGDVMQVSYELFYADGDFHLQTFATICTTAYDIETRTGSWQRDYYTCTASEHTYPDGTTAQLIEAVRTGGDDDDYRMLDAYRIRDDVLYRIHIPYHPADESSARDVLDRWLAGLA